MPVVRTFAPIVAGVGRMHYQTFIKYNVIAVLSGAPEQTLLGYFLVTDRFQTPITICFRSSS